MLMRVLAVLTLAATSAAAQERPQTPIIASHAVVSPRIDGVLDDQPWSSTPIDTGNWLSYNPLNGASIPQTTKVWVTLDDEAIYFAFQCDDPDPGRIKTSVSRRDNIGADDWVGVSLDALGTGQLSYHMMVNPSGVQLDMLNSAAGNEDASVDWLWQSAGRLTATGYVVEMRLPLTSIRFASGDQVRMGVLFWRKVSRSGISVAWPSIEPGKWVFDRHAPLMLDRVPRRLPRDVMPSMALSGREVRTRPDNWNRDGHARDFGVSARIGVTSQILIDATVNPDFSQVESDAFQVEVNERFPVFYSEKRPFFMEGAGIFSLAGTNGGDNSLRRAVHSRRIIDPIAGIKVTGNTGKLTFATLTASDQSPGKGLDAGDPLRGRDRLYNIARTQYSTGPGDYVGAIFTDTEFAGDHNRVLGADLSQRLSSAQRVDAFVLTSHSLRTTGLTRADEPRSGVGGQVNYSYNTRPMSLMGSVEHYSADFRMDTAFINRVNMTSGWFYVDHSFYPSSPRFAWIRRVTPFTFNQGGVDRNAGGRDLIAVSGVRMNFTRLGFLRIDRTWGFEPWAHERFARGGFRAWGNVQLFRWLKIDGRVDGGRSVYYDPQNPFAGTRRRMNGGIVYQPNGRFAQTFSVDRVTFDRRADGSRVYRVDIINSKTTYQFTRELFVRGIAQYDSSLHRVLADLLLSYELSPGSVAYLGWGGLVEQRQFDGEDWTLGQGPYRLSQRGFFAKVSYRWQF